MLGIFSSAFMTATRMDGFVPAGHAADGMPRPAASRRADRIVRMFRRIAGLGVG